MAGGVIEHRWQLWLLGWAASAALLGVLYLWQRRTRDATAVDAGWGGSLVALRDPLRDARPGRRSCSGSLIALPVGLENLRIASLVPQPARQGRGLALPGAPRAAGGRRAASSSTFAIFYQAQALLAAILSVPALLASFNRNSALAPVQWAGVALWVVAAALEATRRPAARRVPAATPPTAAT